MKILCYAPYLSWQIHAAWEATMLLALQAEGAEVRYLLCDGMYPICDLDTPTNPRTPQKCEKCQAVQAGFLSQLPLDFHWLNRYLTDADRADVADWIAGLREAPLAQVERATFDGQPLQSWVRASLHLMFKVERLDLGNPDLRNVFIAFLEGDALAYRALNRAFEQHQPDLLFVFNGLRGSTKVAMEVARARGVRLLSHERGGLKEMVRLVEDDQCNAPGVLARVWDEWKDVPLTTEQLHVAAKQLKGLAEGTNLSWIRYSPVPGQATDLHRQLNLDPDKPIWAAFPSSLYEFSGDPAHGTPEVSQDDWLIATIGFATRHPEIQIVIREHPNRPVSGTFRPIIHALNPHEVAFQQMLETQLPPNMRYLGSKSAISSYDLIEASTLGIAYISTVTVEMASRGMNVVMAGNGGYRGLPFLKSAFTLAALDQAYETALSLPIGARDPEIARQAHRFVYAWFHRWMLHLPMVEMPTPFTGKFRFRSVDELMKSKETGPDLERLRRIVFDGASVIPSPSLAERRRDDGDEVAFFGLSAARPPFVAATALPAPSHA
ncbi:MAG TPA: hypothetical protein VGP07_03450 [Polyangia bacterium]|jgi:hypothetical protein